MTDYTAHDIHRLDQAYPDALASIDHLANDTARHERLAHVGPEVFAADLTRELAATFDKGMSLAGWAAVATTRLIEANARLDELNAEVGTAGAVRKQRDALTAELDKTRAALAESRAQAATYANEVGRLTAENARLLALVAKVEEIGRALDQTDEKNVRMGRLNEQYHGYGARLLYAVGDVRAAEVAR